MRESNSQVEIEDDELWERKFRDSPEVLAKLRSEAIAEIEAGLSAEMILG